MNVLKFGGSSVANAGNINKVIDIIKKQSEKDKLFVVVSALGGVTDLLLKAGEKPQKEMKNIKKLFQKLKTDIFRSLKSLYL